MLDTAHLLIPTSFPPVNRGELHTLQVNLGFMCNQSCIHCHVNAGPNRTEHMPREVIELVLETLQQLNLKTLDLTGGAPELNSQFKYLVGAARSMGVHVIDRCNLTILEEVDQHGLADFLAGQQVEIIASLPCYLKENVDQQRGKGVFTASIDALKRLNRLGYGQQGNDLKLNLVYNPIGTYLPPSQTQLENDYKRLLKSQYDVEFNQLYTITNMPIQRFGSYLRSKGEFETYLRTLRDAYKPENLDAVMCRHLISVDWQGYIYDCDFNQMLNMPLLGQDSARLHLRDLKSASFVGQSVQVAEHCYGCTAGQGSSCGGALDSSR